MSICFWDHGDEPLDFSRKMHNIARADSTTRPYIYDSIWNEFGPYGSIWSWTSIWNPESIYGSDYSDLSPWDPDAFDPPYIFVNDEPVASFTTNYLFWDAIDPWDFFDWVEQIGY